MIAQRGQLSATARALILLGLHAVGADLRTLRADIATLSEEQSLTPELSTALQNVLDSGFNQSLNTLNTRFNSTKVRAPAAPEKPETKVQTNDTAVPEALGSIGIEV